MSPATISSLNTSYYAASRPHLLCNLWAKKFYPDIPKSELACPLMTGTALTSKLRKPERERIVCPWNRHFPFPPARTARSEKLKARMPTGPALFTFVILFKNPRSSLKNSMSKWMLILKRLTRLHKSLVLCFKPRKRWRKSPRFDKIKPTIIVVTWPNYF